MTERKYSVSEIDRMRAAVAKLVPYPSLSFMSPPGGFGGMSEMTPSSRIVYDGYLRQVEERLRTYMMAGVDPEDLERQAQKPGDAAPQGSAKENK